MHMLHVPETLVSTGQVNKDVYHNAIVKSKSVKSPTEVYESNNKTQCHINKLHWSYRSLALSHRNASADFQLSSDTSYTIVACGKEAHFGPCLSNLRPLLWLWCHASPGTTGFWWFGHRLIKSVVKALTCCPNIKLQRNNWSNLKQVEYVLSTQWIQQIKFQY